MEELFPMVNSVGASESSSDSEASPKTIPHTTRFEVSIALVVFNTNDCTKVVSIIKNRESGSVQC